MPFVLPEVAGPIEFSPFSSLSLSTCAVFVPLELYPLNSMPHCASLSWPALHYVPCVLGNACTRLSDYLLSLFPPLLCSYVSDSTTVLFVVFLLFIIPSQPCCACQACRKPVKCKPGSPVLCSGVG